MRLCYGSFKKSPFIFLAEIKSKISTLINFLDKLKEFGLKFINLTIFHHAMRLLLVHENFWSSHLGKWFVPPEMPIAERWIFWLSLHLFCQVFDVWCTWTWGYNYGSWNPKILSKFISGNKWVPFVLSRIHRVICKYPFFFVLVVLTVVTNDNNSVSKQTTSTPEVIYCNQN